jgi:hypothetical protein
MKYLRVINDCHFKLVKKVLFSSSHLSSYDFCLPIDQQDFNFKFDEEMETWIAAAWQSWLMHPLFIL